MKTLKVSDGSHEKLTALLGELIARTGKMWTYVDVIDALLERSVKLPTKLVAEVESFIEENKQLGYTTKEEFIRDSVRTSLKKLSEGKTYLEIPKKDSDELKGDQGNETAIHQHNRLHLQQNKKSPKETQKISQKKPSLLLISLPCRHVVKAVGFYEFK